MVMGILGSDVNDDVEIMRFWIRAVFTGTVKREWVKSFWGGKVNVVFWLIGCRRLEEW